jgi:hypothetical protein
MSGAQMSPLLPGAAPATQPGNAAGNTAGPSRQSTRSGEDFERQPRPVKNSQ